MKTVYYTIFIKILSFYRKIGSFDLVFMAVAFFSGLIYFYLLFFLKTINLFVEYSSIFDKKITFYAILGTVYLFNHFLFLRNDRYKKIEKDIKQIKIYNNVITDILTVLFSIGAIVLLFINN